MTIDSDSSAASLSESSVASAERAVTATRLPSLTNRVYRLDGPGGSVIVRLAGAGTEQIIDRRAELSNHEAAARLGLAPSVLWSAVDAGIMITPAVADARPLSEADLQRPGPRSRLATALRRLHRSDAEFESATDLASELERYEPLVDVRGEERGKLRAALEVGRAAAADLVRDGVPRVPSHNDPTPANALDDGHEVCLVDWEYSGANDPAWDLATAIMEGGLKGEAADHFLAEYYGRDPTVAERRRLELHRVGLDVLAGFWALSRAGAETESDLRGYAWHRLDRALGGGAPRDGCR
ncbi:MAG: phosphotransferase [Anaerolineae bacterium]